MIIQIKDLTKCYNSNNILTNALNGVSFEIDKGEFAAIMGPSGCGKSTLLNILGMLDKPTGGNYFFDNKEVGNLSEISRARFRKNNIGFIFQNFNLIEYLTVFENIEMPLIYQKIQSTERIKKIKDMLEYFGLPDKKNCLPSNLSGGEQQRVAVARALVGEPALILADEPTGNLDSANGREILNYLLKINRGGATVVMVTHSDEYAAFAGRIIKLRDGRIDG